jgi:hypothetical protein
MRYRLPSQVSRYCLLEVRDHERSNISDRLASARLVSTLQFYIINTKSVDRDVTLQRGVLAVLDNMGWVFQDGVQFSISTPVFNYTHYQFRVQVLLVNII